MSRTAVSKWESGGIFDVEWGNICHNGCEFATLHRNRLPWTCAVAVALAFAVSGLFRWIKRGGIREVDRSILALAAFCRAYIGAPIS